MIIFCVICHDTLIQSDDSTEIYFTDCGHAFHFQCIDEWLSRSQTCPHCREKVTRDKIHRAYFSIKDETSSNISQSSSSNISQSLLEEKIANLEFQNLLKDKNIKNFVSKTKVLKKQNAELRQEVRNVESEMNKKNNIIYELNEKIKHLNETSSQYEVLKEEFSKTKKKLDGLKRTIVQKQNRITTLKTNFKWQLNFYERERQNLSNDKLEQCITSEQDYTTESCYRNSNNDSLVTSRKGFIYNQTDTRQKTKNQNDSPSPPWISTGMNEEEYTLDTTFGECPSSTKKARLFLHQSGNDSSEIRTITYDDYDVRNVSSTNKQSKKKKILKVKSIL